jgi:hypothetical protein
VENHRHGADFHSRSHTYPITQVVVDASPAFVSKIITKSKATQKEPQGYLAAISNTSKLQRAVRVESE